MSKNKFNSNCPTTAYGGSNPYSYCSSCEQSEPYISIDGHHDDCKWMILQDIPDSVESLKKMVLELSLENVELKRRNEFLEDVLDD